MHRGVGSHMLTTNVCVYGYLLAVFVGWFVVVHWNSSLIFTLHQLISIVSHELTQHTNENRDIFVICPTGE